MQPYKINERRQVRRLCPRQYNKQCRLHSPRSMPCPKEPMMVKTLIPKTMITARRKTNQLFPELHGRKHVLRFEREHQRLIQLRCSFLTKMTGVRWHNCNCNNLFYNAALEQIPLSNDHLLPERSSSKLGCLDNHNNLSDLQPHTTVSVSRSHGCRMYRYLRYLVCRPLYPSSSDEDLAHIEPWLLQLWMFGRMKSKRRDDGRRLGDNRSRKSR